jgi:hypothetical protein
MVPECFDRYDFDYIGPKSSKFNSHIIASLSCGTPGTEFVGHSTGIEPQMRMRSNASMTNIGQTECESCFYIYLKRL